MEGLCTGADFCCGFTGSLAYSSTEEALSALSRAIGPYAHRYPDGETGKRNKWITWQREVFESSAQFEVASSYTNRDGMTFEMFRPVLDTSALNVRLGYAEHAAASYAVFRRLREEGRVPRGPRFQVSLPTPTAILTVFVDRGYREAMAPLFRAAMRNEVAGVLAAVPEDDLAVQWDVAVEMIGYEGGGAAPRYPLHISFDRVPSYCAEEIASVSADIPTAVELGVHFCYGTAVPTKDGPRRAVEPKDLGASVLFANLIDAGCQQRLDWVHMLSPRDRFDRAWFAPLAGLREGLQVFLGVVHIEDGVPGAVARCVACDTCAGKRYPGVAAECGLGGLQRRTPAEMETILAVHGGAVNWLNRNIRRLRELPGGSITVEALRQYSGGDPTSRLQQCVARIVEEVHGAIRDLRPQPEEWQLLLDFLGRTAQCCTEARNEFIMLFDFLGVRPLLDELEVSTWPQDATPPSAVGPFRGQGVPAYPAHGGDLWKRPPSPAVTRCEYHFSAVSCGDRQAVKGALFEVWMADQHGMYSVRDLDAPKHNLYGEFPADSEGCISFWAIKPKNYGVNTNGTGGTLLKAWGKSPVRPGHVHVAVHAPDFETIVTALYFDDDPFIWEDPAWGPSPPLVVSAKVGPHRELSVQFAFALRPAVASPPPPKKAACSLNNRITEAALKKVQGCEDKRTREVLTVVIQRLHSLARELRPSLEEFGRLLRFLWGARGFCTPQRNEFELFSQIHGCTALVAELSRGGHEPEATSASAFDALVAGTPCVEVATREACAYIFEVRASGSTGVVPAAEVELWMDGGRGLLSEGGCLTDKCMRARCDGRGHCRFEGFVPTAYAVPSDGPTGELLRATGRCLVRPAHVALRIRAEGFVTLETALYDKADSHLLMDPLMGVHPDLVVDFSSCEVNFCFYLAAD